MVIDIREEDVQMRASDPIASDLHLERDVSRGGHVAAVVPAGTRPSVRATPRVPHDTHAPVGAGASVTCARAVDSLLLGQV